MKRITLVTSFLQGGLFMVLAISLVGCAGAPQATAPQATQAAGPAETEKPVTLEKTIIIAIPEDPPSFNAAISDSGYDALVMHMTLLGMAGIGPDSKVYPELAAELPTLENGGVVIDKDSGAMDVTWKMRTDINWADGTPVTADDVLFTYQAITDPNTGSWIPGIDLVTGVEKVDNHQFIVHFSSVYPSYLTLFGGRQVVIWPKHYCKADQGFQAWDCGRQPLSNGPFSLEEWVTGDHLTLTRNPKYYQAGKPAIDKVIVKIVPDAAVRETMLRQGDVDVLMWATENIADYLKNETNLKISTSSSSRFVMRLFLSFAAKGSTDPQANPSPFFSDVRVRQAIRAAIDVDTISNSVWHGFAVPVWTEFFRPPYNTCDIARPKFDPEAAKVLLEQAGWVDTDGDGIRECQACKTAKDGEKLKFELLTYSEYGEPLTLTQQLIAEMLKKVGIQADLNQVQGSMLWADSTSGGIEQTGNFEANLYDDGYAGNDPTDFLRQYYDSASAEQDQGWNSVRYKNPKVDELIQKAYTLNETDRQAAFCEIAQILETDLPEILLFSTLNADAYSTRLDGIQSNVNSVVSWNIADWKIVK